MTPEKLSAGIDLHQQIENLKKAIKQWELTEDKDFYLKKRIDNYNHEQMLLQDFCDFSVLKTLALGKMRKALEGLERQYSEL